MKHLWLLSGEDNGTPLQYSCLENPMDGQKRKILRRGGKNTQKHYTKKDNHNGVITHLEPDILECEVNWALESITTNKASGGDGIPVELSKS